MTHDELLAEIKSRVLHPAQDITNPITWEHKAKLADALRAVVELHKPNPYSGEGTLMCGYCEWDSYPCGTIEAIEKELN